MARQLLRDVSETTRQIMDGELDAELDAIAQAVRARVKDRFQVGSQVRVRARDNELDGEVGVVIKVNPSRVAVGFGVKGDLGFYAREFNVPHELLEVV